VTAKSPGWWRRNRWALIALIVLIPGALAAAFSVYGFGYFGNQARQAVVVADGETGSFTTQAYTPDPTASPTPQPDTSSLTVDISLTDYTVVPWDSDTGREVGLVEGTEAVSAILHVDATGLPDDVFGCDAILAAPGPGGERVWEIASGSDIDYYPSGDLVSYCDLGSGEEFDWEAVFVVPEGVGDDATLFITDGGFPPARVLRMAH
jgi:hypothetical protein